MKHFKLNNYNLSLLQEKTKIYNYLNGKLDKLVFRLSGNSLVICLNGADGAILTTLEIEYENGSAADDKNTYFSTDYQKWNTTLQKFAGAEALHLSLSDSILRIKVDGSQDVITLGVISYEDGSHQAEIVNRYIPQRKAEIQSFNHKIVLTPEIISDFDLVGNLFTSQGRVNSIGLSDSDVMYSDRSTVVKINLDETLPKDLFDSMEDGENHVHLHSYVLKLFSLLTDFNQDVWFDKDYEILYWGDSNTEIIYTSESRNISLPTQEQFDGIKPQNRDTFFDINLNLLKTSLSFFLGFYDNDIWKPVTFVLEKDKDILLKYEKPTADITKTLTGVVSPFNTKFMVDSEVLRKIIQKISDRYTDDDCIIRFNCDDDTVNPGDEAPGVYCTVGDTYEFVICKLQDD